MHEHLEIILPPTDDIEGAVKSIMARWDENGDDEEGYRRHAFWDFYVIGGRWAGSKLMASYDQAKIDEFHQWCHSEKITVSGVQCGKQTLEPASQIAKVDAKWNEMFPSGEGDVMVACPIFSHSNDQYGRDGRGTIEGDICTLKEAMAVKCSRLIFAGPGWSSETRERTGPLEAVYMISDTIWNGLQHVETKWDGTVSHARRMFEESLERNAEGYRQQMTPHDDWLAVTVDYHT